MVRRDTAEVATEAATEAANLWWTSEASDIVPTEVMVLDDLLNDGLWATQSSSLPDLESIEDATTQEEKQKHDLDLHCEED